MAAIAPTVTAIGRGDGSTLRVVWTPVTANDTCVAVSYPECSDKSIQGLGTFDSGSIALQGSNDGGTTYAALHDPGGTTIAITSAGIKAVLENTELIKPVVSSGGGSQSITVAMLLHLTNPLRT